MLGTFIREVREAAGMTQAEVAVLARVSQPNVSAYEADVRTPTAATLNRLILACGYQLAAVQAEREVRCEVPLLFGGRLEGDPPDEGPTLDPAASPETRGRVLYELLRLADALRPAGR